MVVVRVAQGQETLMLEEIVIVKRDYILLNSEWRVKVTGSQSCMRLGQLLLGRLNTVYRSKGLGQEVYGGRIVGSDLSPHWSNMIED